MKVIGVDPGRTDPFACVLVEVIDEKIKILGCKFWVNHEYNAVYKELERIANQHNIQYLVVEKNSIGDPIGEELKINYNLPVQLVYTGKTLQKPRPHVMDKAEMVTWLIQAQQDGVLLWPKEDDDYMKELKRQWAIFGEYHKNKFEAPSGEHDDLVMALMLACFFIRERLLKLSKSTYQIVHKKFKPRSNHDYLESGIPNKPWITSMGSSTKFP